MGTYIRTYFRDAHQYNNTAARGKLTRQQTLTLTSTFEKGVVSQTGSSVVARPAHQQSTPNTLLSAVLPAVHVPRHFFSLRYDTYVCSFLKGF